MSRHAPLVKDLAARLRSMDVASLVYFHTDHFEPWRSVGDAPAVGQEIVDAIGDFCRVTEKIDFARRLTLFYKPHLNYALRTGDDLVRADPRDLVGFLERTEHEERFGKEAMREVATASAHDIQLHIHHEYYTATTAHADPDAVAWFAGPLGRALDRQRLELAIGLNRAIMARETGRSTERWFFIHGHWALNASDDTSCTITDEIDLLLRNGCRGDFTFPAGRQHTNPRIAVPYLCRPFDAPKGYDRPEAEPEIAFGNAAAAASKFFVWSSPASNLQCSLDYLSASSRRQIDDTGKAARELIDNAYIAGRRLFIKTHAHSMHSYYFEHARTAVLPHQHPSAQALLSVIFEAAAEAGLEIQFLTAPEVYDLLVTAEAKPEIDLVATYLKPPRLKRAGLLRTRAPVAPSPAPSAVAPASLEAATLEAATPEPVDLAPDRALALVRDTTAAVLQQRIDALGVRGSGAYEHYSAMLQRGFSLPPHELTALEIVRQQAPRLAAYHEIGSGIGTLPFLLALNGFPAVGIECDRRRHETALAVWQALSAKAEVGKPACRLVFGRFPATAARHDAADALAILTDFVTTQSAEQRQAIIDGLRRYPYVLLDLRRFCLVREASVAQLELLGELEAQGLTRAGDIISATDSAFVLLRNDARKARPRFASWLKLPWRGRMAGHDAPDRP
ncbi:MAG: hypothetical protein AB7F22_27895 [Reyranella sp.]|uniref:hypothetical protein n=1 Tax=Reyranella sp. TaxID=1929291 RepID=UPI003D0B6CF5